MFLSNLTNRHDVKHENIMLPHVLSISPLHSAGRAEDRNVRARPSRFARMLDVLGLKKLAQDPHRKPHTLPNRACNVPDVTCNTPLHVNDALNPSSLAIVLNQLHKLDAPLSNQAAECLGTIFFLPILSSWNWINVLISAC